MTQTVTPGLHFAPFSLFSSFLFLAFFGQPTHQSWVYLPRISRINPVFPLLTCWSRCLAIASCLNGTFLRRKDCKQFIPELRRKFMIRLVDTKMRGGASGQGDSIGVAMAPTKQWPRGQRQDVGRCQLSGEVGGSNSGDLEESSRDVIDKGSIVREVKVREILTWHWTEGWVRWRWILVFTNVMVLSDLWGCGFSDRLGMETEFL